jgi:hypothetical protein
MMRAILFSLLIMACTSLAPAGADESPKPAPLESLGAFEKAYAASFYEFDACGDGIAGRIYRSALVARLKQCPFSAAAKQHFPVWAAAQRRMSTEAIDNLIEAHGGLPIRLDGMARTCREQMESSEYRVVRGRLDDFAAGRLTADAVVAQPCDAAEISP